MSLSMIPKGPVSIYVEGGVWYRFWQFHSRHSQ